LTLTGSPGRRPARCCDLRQRRVDHPFAHFDRQRVVLDHWQEQRRRQQAALRMLPADQRLGAPPPRRCACSPWAGSAARTRLRLKRLADALQAFVLAAHMAVLVGVEHVVTVLASQLGLVHGLVGLAQQLVGFDVLCCG
jgi:hypothetical protein